MIQTTKRQTLLMLLAIASLAGISLIVRAGQLEPPGPPAPTMKNLDTVEARIPIRASDMPLSIATPGSYFFVEDIVAASGITIDTTCVTIDMNGFALFGDGSGSGDGIVAGIATENVEIRNGVVSSWAGDGIDLALATNSRVLDLRVSRNTGNGVVLGDDSVLRDSSVSLNQMNGVLLSGSRSLLRDNLINSNTLHGILVDGDHHQIRDNSISNNQVYGLYVLNFADGQIIVDNLLSENASLSIEFTEFSGGHIVARNIARKSSLPNFNSRAGDWGPESTAAAATSPMGNISN